MNRLFSITTALAIALLAAGDAVAQPINSFKIGADPGAGEYTLGDLVGQNPSIVGWTGAWNDGFQGDRAQVVETGLSYSTVPVEGGAVEFAAMQDGRAGRNLSNPVNGSTNRTMYFSFMMQAVGATDGSQITYSAFEMHNPNGLGDGDRQLQIGVGENLDGASQTPNYFVSLFNSDEGSGFATDLGTNDELVNFFVGKFELSDADNADVFTLWHNPEDLSDEGLSSVDFTTTGFNIELNSSGVARFGAAGILTYDELRFGNSFTSVTSPVAAFVPGDTDGDFVVELDDFDPIRDNWLETNGTFGMSLDRGDGDLNLDGMVSIEDFREWKNAFLGSGGAASEVADAFALLGATAPEPAGLALLIMAGMGGLLGGRRRAS